MKLRIIFLISTVFACSLAFASYKDYDCQVSCADTGDLNIVTLGGFTFAKPISIDLAPTNAPDENVQYSICCQVIYKDNKIPRPMSDDELKTVFNTGAMLNSWLTGFIYDRYCGQDYGILLQSYISGNMAQNVNEDFPEYVAGKIYHMDPSDCIDVNAVTVVVNAEGAFREDIEAENASQESE